MNERLSSTTMRGKPKTHVYVDVSKGKLRCDYGDKKTSFPATKAGATKLGEEIKKRFEEGKILGLLYSSSVDFPGDYGGEDIDLRAVIEAPSMQKVPFACPFCGSKAKVYVKHPVLPNGMKDTFFRVKCTLRECGVVTRWWYPKRAAVASWNRRDA